MSRYVSFATTVAAGPWDPDAPDPSSHDSASPGFFFFCIALGIGIGRVVLDIWLPRTLLRDYRTPKNG